MIADRAGLSGAAAGAGAIAQPRLVRMPLADPTTVVDHFIAGPPSGDRNQRGMSVMIGAFSAPIPALDTS